MRFTAPEAAALGRRPHGNAKPRKRMVMAWARHASLQNGASLYMNTQEPLGMLAAHAVHAASSLTRGESASLMCIRCVVGTALVPSPPPFFAHHCIDGDGIHGKPGEREHIIPTRDSWRKISLHGVAHGGRCEYIIYNTRSRHLTLSLA